MAKDLPQREAGGVEGEARWKGLGFKTQPLILVTGNLVATSLDTWHCGVRSVPGWPGASSVLLKQFAVSWSGQLQD